MANYNLSPKTFSIENTPSAMAKSMFFYIQSCGHFSCEASYFTDRQDYGTFLIISTLKGKGYLKYRGKQYSLESGSIFIIDCLEYQYYATDKNSLWEFDYIHFNGCESKKYLDRISENDGIVMKLKSDSFIPSNLDKLISMSIKKSENFDIKASCIIVEILTELLLNSINPSINNNIPDYIENAITLIESNYTSKLTLDIISKEVNVNKFYLTRQFKKYTTQSLYEYIINYRINKSKELLKNTQKSVCEISEKIGFESVSQFVKLFKQNENTTPLKFRKYWR